MAWGDIFSNPAILSAATSTIFGDNSTAGNILGGLGSAYNVFSTAQKKDAAQSAYESALKQQKGISSALSQESLRQIQEDARLRQSLLQQTGELGSNLRAAYTQLGPIPSISPATIAADYGQLRAQSQNDFQNLVKLTTSQIGASNLSQLGGARNPAMEELQQRQILEKFAPIQQQLDTAAYAEAVNRSSTLNTALTQNRQNINATISGALSPQISAESGLYAPGRAAATSGTASQAISNYLTPQSEAGKIYTEELNANLGNLAGYISQSTKPKQDVINWNAPAQYPTQTPYQTVFPTR